MNIKALLCNLLLFNQTIFAIKRKKNTPQLGILLLFIPLFSACDTYDPIPEIEALLETKLPTCYTEVENPEKVNPEAIYVVEYKCPVDCCMKFWDQISEVGIQRSYCGTTADYDLTMAFCTRDNSALLTFNTINGILHYEKFEIENEH